MNISLDMVVLAGGVFISASGRFITGVAAIGTYMPDGSAVELRAAPVKTGNQIIVGYYPNGDPDYQDETTPSEIRTATVSGGEGKYTVDVTGLSEPYIVRVQCGGRWYYSYADGNSDTANVNPYSDWMVRSYYLINTSDCPGGVEIDNKFTSGVMDKYDYSDNVGLDIVYTKWSYGFNKTGRVWENKSLPIPDVNQIKRSMAQLQYIFSQRYGIDIGDILTRDWVVGETYDSILDSGDIDWNYIQRFLSWSYYADDMIEYGIAYYHNTDQLYVEAYSKYPYMWQNGRQVYYTDVNNGIYHFIYDGTNSGSTYIDISISMNNENQITNCSYGMTTYNKL